MKSVDNVGVTFVNTVVGRGIMNNVVNLQFGTFQFSPDEASSSVDSDLAVSCRLRMDVMCAVQLYETLGGLLAAVKQAEAEADPVPGEQAEVGAASEKPN